MEESNNKEGNKMALDLLGLGKVLPMDKLTDMITKTFGRCTQSYFYRRDADAKAYELRKLAEAQAEAARLLAQGQADVTKIMSTAVNENHPLTGGIEYKSDNLSISSPKELPIIQQPVEVPLVPLEQRTQGRIEYQEAKKQINVESVTSFAAEELQSEETVSDVPVNEDWTTRFFKIVEDVSDEKMQAIWGKILAGEIKQPHSFSLRTLELLRNLSKEEAEILARIASFTLNSHNENFLFKGGNGELFTKYHIKDEDISIMVEVGILQSDPKSVILIEPTEEPSKIVFKGGDHTLVFELYKPLERIVVPICRFTKAGRELLGLIEISPTKDYVLDLGRYLKFYGARKVRVNDLAFDS